MSKQKPDPTKSWYWNRTCKGCGVKRQKGDDSWAQSGEGYQYCGSCLQRRWEDLKFQLSFKLIPQLRIP
jgi:hypothetical protein